MADTRVLLVPVALQALVVNDQVRIGQNFQRWSMNYGALDQFLSPEPQAFSGNANDFAQEPRNNGVYLHWTLPAALRQGRHDKVADRTAFPLVPNRWLVLRYSGDLGQRKVTAWVVESDFVDPNNGTAPYLDPGSAVPRATHIGRRVDLNTPRQWEETSKGDLFLTAVGPANPTFSAYQPYGENVFSIHDTLDGVGDKATLSYLVAGWYSARGKDLLADLADFGDLEQRLGWTVDPPEGDVPHDSIYHGMVYGVQWDKLGAMPASDRPADGKGVCLAVGNTAVDALTALIAAEAKKSGKGSLNPKLLEAFQYGLLKLLDEPNGNAILQQKIHEHGFGPRAGGYVWELVSKQETQPQDPATPLAADPPWLALLNQDQAAYDDAADQLQGMQRDLYALWWKQQYAAQLPSSRYPSDIRRAEFDSELDPANQSGLLHRVYQQLQEVLRLRALIPWGDTPEELADAIARYAAGRSVDPTLELKRQNRSRFWEANAPVVVLSGTKASGLLTEDGPLLCRTSDQIITGFRHGETAITAATMQGGIPAADLTNLPAVMRALLTEFFFLDPDNATMVALWALKSSDPQVGSQVRQSMASRTQYIGHVPALDLDPWRQPWAPLFLMWEIFYYPIDFGTGDAPNWRFNGTEYEWTGTGAQTSDALVYSGRIFLTPQASFNFRNQIEKYLKEHPNPNLEALQAFIEETNKWDFLAQSLDGFNQQLALRDPMSNRSPDDTQVLFPPNVTLAALLGSAADYVPNPGVTTKPKFGEWPPSKFREFRSGQFYFNRLMVVDRFGQSIEVVNSQTSSQFTPVVAEGLLPAKTVMPDEPYRFVQTPPRLLQPGRLRFDFISDQDHAKRVDLESGANPVCAWVLPNHLNRSLCFYDNVGGAIGEIYTVTDRQGQHVLHWEGAPGSPYTDLAAVAGRFPHLGGFLQGLTVRGAEEGPRALRSLLSVIDKTLWVIDPTGDPSEQTLAVMVGRPLALVRTQLQFQLAGPPAADPSWRYTFKSKTPDFVGYPFPIRLGDLEHRGDGLVGYFLGNDYTRFNAVYNPGAPDSYIAPIGDGNYIHLPFDGSTAALATMLVDPRASVHAVTEILPTVAVVVPQRFVRQALPNMQVRFRVGPLLTDAQVTADGKVSVILPPPATQAGTWLWAEQGPAGLVNLDVAAADQTARLSSLVPTLRTGHLALSDGLKAEEE